MRIVRINPHRSEERLRKFSLHCKMLMKRHLVSLALVTLALTKTVGSFENFESDSVTPPDRVFLQSSSVRNILRGASNFKSGIARCDLDIKQLTDALLKKEEWALKVIDSSSYFIHGFLSGNLGGLGNFDECLEIRLPREENSHWALYSLVEVEIEQKTPLKFARRHMGDSVSDFLLALLSSLQNKTLSEYVFSDAEGLMDRSPHYVEYMHNNGSVGYLPVARIDLGICFPRSCGTQVPRKFVELLWSPLYDVLKKSNYRLEVLPPRPNDEQVGLPRKFRIADWCVTGFCAIWAALCAFSTILDVLPKIGFSDLKITGWKSHLLAFSFYTNVQKLFTVRSDGNNSHLTALDGLRVASVALIILGHRCLLEYTFLPSTNLIAATNTILKSWRFQLIAAMGNGAVDIFFTTGGVLNAYLFLKYMEKHKKFNFFEYIIHRYFRLTPLLALSTGITTTWFYYLNDGPLWNKIVGEERRKCQQLWWSNILYIGNYIHYQSSDYFGTYPCVGHVWYLMVDMQMYCFAILVLLPLWYWRKAGTVWLSFLIAVSGAIPFTIAYIYDFRAPFPFYSFWDSKIALDYMYFAAYSRASPYLVGILTGYILYRVRSNSSDFRLGSKSLAAASILVIVLGLFIIFAHQPLNDFQLHIDTWISALYLGFHRIVWSLCVSWVVFVCATGHGGWINTILSFYPFRVLNRLVYGMYLAHVAVQGEGIASSRVPIFFTETGFLRRFTSDFLITALFGGILVLGFEQPLRFLEKNLFRGHSEKEEPIDITNNNVLHQIKVIDEQTKL